MAWFVIGCIHRSYLFLVGHCNMIVRVLTWRYNNMFCRVYSGSYLMFVHLLVEGWLVTLTSPIYILYKIIVIFSNIIASILPQVEPRQTIVLEFTVHIYFVLSYPPLTGIRLYALGWKVDYIIMHFIIKRRMDDVFFIFCMQDIPVIGERTPVWHLLLLLYILCDVSDSYHGSEVIMSFIIPVTIFGRC